MPQASGSVLGEAIWKALGSIPETDRIVIVADVSGESRIFIRATATTEQAASIGSHLADLVKVVKDVQVSDTGDVTVVPLNADEPVTVG